MKNRPCLQVRSVPRAIAQGNVKFGLCQIDLFEGGRSLDCDLGVCDVEPGQARQKPTVVQKRRSGETPQKAIEAVDAATGAVPAYDMINCLHQEDFGPTLENAPWADRVRGLRANASSLDHGALCQLGHLEEEDPDELARQYCDLCAADIRTQVGHQTLENREGGGDGAAIVHAHRRIAG